MSAALFEQKKLALAGRPCWLKGVRDLLKSTPFGCDVWSLFINTEGFKGPCYRIVHKEGLDQTIRWEMDFEKDLVKRLDTEWWERVAVGASERKVRRNLKVSAKWMQKNKQDLNVRNVHMQFTHKTRSYAFFKSQALRQEAYL